jgi:hypothetical protein
MAPAASPSRPVMSIRKHRVLTLIAAIAGILLVVYLIARPPSRAAVVAPVAAPLPSTDPSVADAPGDAADAQFVSPAVAPSSPAEPLPNPDADVAAVVTANEGGDEAAPVIEAEDIEEDPYAYNEPITEVPDDAGVQSTSEAPLTAAVDEAEMPLDELDPEPAQGPVISASGPPPPADIAESRPSPVRTTRAGVYQGSCAAAKVPGDPVRWMDLPADARATFPLPHAAAVAYATGRAQRFIVIDDAVFREDDLLPNGLRLISIGPSSVVLASSGCVVDIPLRLMQR